MRNFLRILCTHGLAASACILLYSCNDKAQTTDTDHNAKADVKKSTKHKRIARKDPVKVELPPIPPIIPSGKSAALTDEQINNYLTNSRRSGISLLAAYHIKSDPALLREAAEKFPDIPAVQLELAIRGDTPEAKQQALEHFRKLAPNDALGDYLAALTAIQQGNTEDALKAIALAKTHAQLGSCRAEVTQAEEDAYLTSGQSLAEAKLAALYSQPLTTFMPVNQLASKLAELQRQSLQAGDNDAAETICKSGLDMASKVSSNSKLLIHQMMSLAIETRFLTALPPDSLIPGTQQSASTRLADIAAERKDITALNGKTKQLKTTLSETDFLNYLQQVNAQGELTALRKLGQN